MTLSKVVGQALGFLTPKCPPGVSPRGCVPALVLLRRRLTDDDVAMVVDNLMRPGSGTVDAIDIGVAITKVTDRLPSAHEVETISYRLGNAV